MSTLTHVVSGTQVIITYGGMQGPKGDPGTGADTAETYILSPANTEFTISHTLGRLPDVSVYDDDGNLIDDAVESVSTTAVHFVFGSAFTGKAVLD